MLMRRDAAMALYCCPRTGMPLHKEGDRLVVEALEDGPRYDIVDGYPVLVDYERSVLEKSSVQRFLNHPTRHGRKVCLPCAGAGGTDTVDRALSCA